MEKTNLPLSYRGCTDPGLHLPGTQLHRKYFSSIFRFLHIISSGPSNVQIWSANWWNVCVCVVFFLCSWWRVLAIDSSLFFTRPFCLIGPKQIPAPLQGTVGTGMSLCPSVPCMLNQRMRTIMQCFSQIPYTQNFLPLSYTGKNKFRLH